MSDDKRDRAETVFREVAGIEGLSRLERAAILAARLHADQLRKGTKIPYISHLMAVCSLVLEGGGSEDSAIAALLHDAVEDQGASLSDIENVFGAGVAAIVRGVTDVGDEQMDESRRGPETSLERKRAYLKHLLSENSEDILRVSVADKLHNARSILTDYLEVGEEVWQRFNVSREDQLWYYQQLAQILLEKLPTNPRAAELSSTVEKLIEAVRSGTGAIRS